MVVAADNTETLSEDSRYDDEEEDIDEFIDYDITATPNDFNLSTIFSFIEGGALEIPRFQRNYVWDIKRASKLIESLIIGLPVPQLFLYEKAPNRFLVIDGQQRLMSIYYFFKQRFPRSNARPHLRTTFQEHRRIPGEVLNDNKYFTDFKLSLPVNEPGKSNKFHGFDYGSLGESQMRFNLRPLRNIVIRQNSPKDNDSAVYEIFSRLNSGGMNLRPQEMRLSLYYSDFYAMLETINTDPIWRRFLHSPEPDIHMKDIEVLLRMFAILVDADSYAPSLVKFLNQFSKKSQANDSETNKYMEKLFKSFISASKHLDKDTFVNKGNGRINIALIEAVFYAICKDKYAKYELVDTPLSGEHIQKLATDGEFVTAASATTTSKHNVAIRLRRGISILGASQSRFDGTTRTFYC